MGQLRQDLRFAVRMLAKTPAFTLLVVLTLALGIGANTAIFSATDALILRPLPYPHSHQLAAVGLRFPRGGGENQNITIGQYRFLRAHCRVCEHIAALDAGSGSNLTGGGRPVRVSSAAVTHQFFLLLGLPLVLGRDFTARQQAAGAPGVVILSRKLWLQRFHGSRRVLGQSVQVNGRLATIIGVAPNADGPGIDLWAPLDPRSPAVARQGPNIATLVRLRPGVALHQAQAEFDVLSGAYHRIAGGRYGHNATFWATSYHQELVGPMAGEVLLLLYAVALVLLVACVNVGNLLLARANARRQEMALRAALGAGRGRLLRQLLTESVLLALAGASVGLLLAAAALPLLRRLLSGVNALSLGPTALPVAIHLNSTVLLFAFGLAAATGMVFGLVPASYVLSGDLHAAIKQEAAASGGGRGRRRASQILVAVEMAVACSLLAGAALVLASFLRLAKRPVGFSPGRVLTLQTALTGPRRRQPSLAANYITGALRRVRRLPGVTAAAASTGMPLVRGMNMGFTAPGTHASGYPIAQWLPVTPQFFRALRLPIVAGRAFTSTDNAGGAPVCIVSADLARHYWPRRNPIGRQIVFGTPRRVVGVAAAARLMGFGQGGQMYNVYIPLAQASPKAFALANGWFPLVFLVRTRGNPALAGLSVRRAIQSADPSQPLFALRTLEQVQGLTLADFQLITGLIAAFAILALVLGAVGIYGVMSHAVGQRRREIGIRMALGASRRRIERMILGQALAVAAVGAGLGAAGAVMASGWLRHQIPGVGALNGWLVAAAVALLMAMAAVAAYRPARQAMRLDPLEALRRE